MGAFPFAGSANPFALSLSKRLLLRYGLASAAGMASLHMPLANALPVRTLSFPRDHGAHPDFRTEWWYITGSAKSGNREFGFQITFFRSRVEPTQGMQSQFAAKQLLFAHAAVTDVQGKKLWHDQQIARAGFGIAQASEADTQVKLRRWSLTRLPYENLYNARVVAKEFEMELVCTNSQPLLLQGKDGLSRKGPDEKQASYYYSQPQLSVAGFIELQGKRFEINEGKLPGKDAGGTAWLDHEWSQELLHPEAVGWDWIGMNLFDGSALTAFQLRKKDGTAVWSGGSYRPAAQAKNTNAGTSFGGKAFNASPFEVQFQALKPWKSPLTAASYPIEWLVRTPADYYTVKAVIPNQELDSRSSTGAVYWEGLSDLFDSNGKHVGRGYLEMTGYAGALRM